MIAPTSQKRIRLAAKLLAEYITFLQDHQCIARSAIAARRNRVMAFLASLKDQATPSKIHSLTSNKIHDYIIESTKSLNRGSRKLLLSSIRSFLKFLYFRGYLNRNLVPAVPVIRTPILASVPRFIPWNWVKKLLSAPDKRTRRGRRNYAILQLLATYGVRIGQALSLRISDIK